jgi:hypothetical protein
LDGEEHSREIVTLREALSKAEKRVRALGSMTGRFDVTQEQERAKLELAVLRAELDYAQACRRHHSSKFCRQTLAWPDSLVTRQNSPGLQEAGLRIAAARAQAAGELRAAQVEVRRKTLALEAIEKLRAEGLASPQEVAEAKEQAQIAQAALQREKSSHERLAESYSVICSKDGEPGAAVRAEMTPRSLPDAIWSHDAGLRQLIALRTSRLAAEAQRAALAARLKMLDELCRRLEQAHRKAGGENRELEVARLDIEYFQALSQAAQECSQVLALAEGFLALLNREPSFIAALERPLDGEAPIWADPFAWLPPNWLTPESERATGSAPRTSRSPTSAVPRESSPGLSGWRVFNWRSPDFGIRSECGPPNFNSTPFREPSYAEYYAFGNRRTDAPPAPCRASPFGFPPWYLPGSSTNFK